MSVNIFGSGPRLDAPEGDASRQAVSSLRGYAYQLYASALAWLALRDGEVLHLEVAEDYAVATRSALAGTQVKDTAASGKATLRTEGVRAAIDGFVDLVTRNPDRLVTLHYLTTSEIGLERDKTHQGPSGTSGLHYWRRAAAGAPVGPLRTLVDGLGLRPETKRFLADLNDEEYRNRFLQRIHWDCGAQDLGDVRVDLEAGLVECVATARGLSSHVAQALTSTVVEHVLTTSVQPTRRSLRRADLLKLIDAAALVAVPIEHLRSAFQGAPSPLAGARTSLLASAAEIPLPPLHAPREIVVSAIDAARLGCGLAIACGATSMGKSLAARLCAAQSGLDWSIADFRNLPPAETAVRLSQVRAELAAAPEAHVILDDLNDLDSPDVRDALIRLLASLRRRDRTAIITTYRAPSRTTLHQLTPDAAQPIDLPYLDEDEVAGLVIAAGGDAKYAHHVYQAGGQGHPLLTMAALLRLRDHGWSRRAIAETLGGASQPDLGAERRATRQRLVAGLPETAQTLLLRASLVRGGFDRDLALELAALSPSLARGGLLLDQLVGPWIEEYRRARLRVSPLLDDMAAEVLTTSERRAVHHCVASNLMGREVLDPSEAPAALYHALRSDSGDLVAGFAHSVITAGVQTLESLVPFLVELRFLPFDRPISAAAPAPSAMMRLAQLLVILNEGTADEARDCWAALQRERAAVVGEQLFETTILSKMLLQQRTAELFDDWLEHLLQFDRLCQADPKMAQTAATLGSGREFTPHATSILFSSQIRSIATVSSFLAILSRLDREAAETRARVLSAFRPGNADIAVLVNHGWLRESRTEDFDWEAAQRDYGAAAAIAAGWGDVHLASRCAIAQAMCIDENGQDRERALACLTEAEVRIGFDAAFGRARAKIHWRARDHAAALPLLTAAAEIGGQSQIEQAYIAREAAISAGLLDDWTTALAWFERAQVAAVKASEIPSVRAMAVGLSADAAQAACRAGRPDHAVTRMAEALKSLPTIDQDGDLTEAHTHRVVRHALLWLYREVTGVAPDGEAIVYHPGAASNPDPHEAVRDHPVVALDISFYMLADIDRQLAEPTGFHLSFRDHLVSGPVLTSEISETIHDGRQAIAAHDPTDFVARLRRHAAMAELIRSGEAHRAGMELVDPPRGHVPLAEIPIGASPALILDAEDYLLSFGTAAALAREFGAIDRIVADGLASPAIAALHPLLRQMSGVLSRPATDRQGAAASLWILREDLTAAPDVLCWCGVWLLMHVHASRLRDGVEQPLVAWLFAAADHLVRHASFRLASPATTTPPVEAVIAAPARTLASSARLLLALVPAVGTRLIPEVRVRMEEIAASDRT